MDISFRGKRALVTGAGQGIGYGVAKALVAGGAETFALSKTQANLDKLKAEVPAVNTVCVDLGDWEKTSAAVSAIGPIDLVVNNAAVHIVSSCWETTPEDFNLQMNINVKAIINVTQIAANTMVERGTGGAVVNVSSKVSQAALQNCLVYSASKAAVDQMTRNFALELGPKNIRVNAVNPTLVMTEMSKWLWSDPVKAANFLSKIPMGRFAEVKDIVHPILYLLSDQADMINGITLPIDGGFLAC